MIRILVIVPAFNEESALGSLLAEIRDVVIPGVELSTVVVDDGSRDRTAKVAHMSGTRVLALCGNLGIGGAVQAGLRLAARERFDWAVQIDGDGQHPPAELARLLEAGRAEPAPDLIIGTRYRDSSDNFRSTPLRRLGSWWLRAVLRVVAGVHVSDPTSGYRLYGPRALALFDDTYPYDFPEPESIAVARRNGLRLVEASVAMRERQGGTSSIAGVATFYYMLKVTVAIVLTYTRTRRSRGEIDATCRG